MTDEEMEKLNLLQATPNQEQQSKKSRVKCIFLVKRRDEKTDEKVCQKSIAKKKKLWYSIGEAWCGSWRSSS